VSLVDTSGFHAVPARAAPADIMASNSDEPHEKSLLPVLELFTNIYL
jgi:hypothetical protein